MLKIEYRQFSNILILFTFLFPTFPALTRTEGTGRIGDMVLVMGILSLILIYIMLYNRSIKTKNLALSLLFTALFFTLISFSILFEIKYITIRDIYEYHKPILILLIFYFFISIPWSSNNLKQYFLKPYTFVFVFFVCYGLIEAFTGPVGQFISTTFYKTNRAILSGKSTGSFGITYFFAVFMLFSTFFFFFKFILKKKNLDLLLIAGSILTLVATQSRTMVLALAVGLLYVFLTYWLFKDFPFKKALYLGTLFIVLLIILLWNPIIVWISGVFPYLYYGIEYLIRQGGVNAEGVGSANIRYQQLLWAWENQFEYPIIGAGIGKGTGPQLESFYALYLYRYGFLGILFAIFLLLFNYITSIRCYLLAKKLGDQDAAAFFIAFSVFNVVLPISSLSSVITDQVRLAILYYGTTAVMIGYLRYGYQKHHCGFNPIK